jgi:hypothetical protein
MLDFKPKYIELVRILLKKNLLKNKLTSYTLYKVYYKYPQPAYG